METTQDKIRRTKKYREIRNSLLDQLSRSGNDFPHYKDMVEDYMKMYIHKEMCNEDVAERGITVTSIGSTGQEVTKKNESVDMALKINQQMIKLLDTLGIYPQEGLYAGEDDEM